MPERADLHMHSHHSDGFLAPADLVLEIARVGLRAASLTDHDTVAGWAEFRRACASSGVEAIPGVEISGRFAERDTHVLGYFVDPESGVLEGSLERFREERRERGREMARRLNALGVRLTFDEVLESAGRGVIGRPHVADVLLRTGAVGSYEEAFRRYLGVGCPAYVPKPVFDVAAAIHLIHEAGGLAVLAHPAGHFNSHEIKGLARLGLDGVEVVHPRHSAANTRTLSEIADANDLFVTGGSDYHGGVRGDARIGDPAIDFAWIAKMKERLGHD